MAHRKDAGCGSCHRFTIHSHRLTTCREDFDDALLYMWFADELVAQVQVSRNHVSGYRVETVIYGERDKFRLADLRRNPNKSLCRRLGLVLRLSHSTVECFLEASIVPIPPNS